MQEYDKPVTLDKSYFSVTGSLVNRDSSRYVRIMWFDNDPDWNRVALNKTLIYGMTVAYQDKPALLLDVSTICLS